ncbi:hypothetical protein KA012_04580, partial [Candidatus Woesebacteria bacterium]|nr:hypothetical protein [Candidatus Woesebacteria bacterium]
MTIESGISPIDNPKFAEQQRMFIDSVKTAPMADVLSPEQLSYIHANKENGGYKREQITDGTTAHFYGHENGIAVLAVATRSQEKNAREIITNYFYIDTETGLAWDALQLVTAVPAGRKNENADEVISTQAIISNHIQFAPREKEGTIRKKGGTFYLHVIAAEYVRAHYRKRFDMAQMEFFYRFFPLHEIGHRYQSYGDATPGDIPKRKPSEFMADFLIESRITFLGKILHLEHILEKEKQIERQRERNASAFALAVVRKLRDEGVDLLRSIDRGKASAVVEELLAGYDKEFAFIPRPTFAS